MRVSMMSSSLDRLHGYFEDIAEGMWSSTLGAHNLTKVSEFHLLGFSEDPDLQPVLFGLFLSMYLVTVLGNLLIILAVSSDSHLHTPMYFFLSNLSLADIGFTSSTVPKLIVDILNHIRVISYVGCLTQMSVFILFACMDNMLLTVMAYDRFVAICHPLHYSTIMNPRLCVLLLLLSVFVSLLDSQGKDSWYLLYKLAEFNPERLVRDLTLGLAAKNQPEPQGTAAGLLRLINLDLDTPAHTVCCVNRGIT
ncbi:Olfactory receptor 7E24 [Fukomys damarensis]|uniref:Olfactory receptor n=1 Tax=Fukomys damarensis TaxID=885580 RepID=A0A091DCG1_FUKDA|nr:Olfactory receptor 7E24 [Fukomys damarensis]